ARAAVVAVGGRVGVPRRAPVAAPPPPTPAAGASETVRLIDQASADTRIAPASGRVIDATWKRTLAPDPAELPLRGVPPEARLRFAVGLQPQREGGTVRFEVGIEANGDPPVRLYARDVATPGWIDEEVALPAARASGARLVFRKSLIDGPDS